MKTASAALKTFLYTALTMARVDLYTITLTGGSILRWCTVPGYVYANGFTFGGGPIVEDGGVKCSRGMDVATLDITLFADNRHTVNGVQFLDFVENLGLDGASFLVERGYAADWPTMRQSGPLGTLWRFSGKLSEVKDHGHTQTIVTVSSPLDLFTNNTPPDVYQTSCLNVLGDAKCGVSISSYAQGGVVSASPVPTQTTFASNLTPADSDYALGKVVFTSGANAGMARTVKSQDTSGNFVLVAPLPAAPAAGDSFTAYPGCNLSTDRCTARFNNLLRFRGCKFIPSPSTGLAS